MCAASLIPNSKFSILNSQFYLFPLLQIKNLSVEFKTESGIHSAVSNISFEVNKGEIVAIVGESGSGKSVTALSILQLLPTTSSIYKSGEILFSKNGIEQNNLLKLPAGQLTAIRGNEISMIFQEPMTSLNPVQTCGSQVREAINVHHNKKNTSKQKTIELFKEVDLPDPSIMLNRYPHQLSGGQKQRVMIAMAMSCNPSLLIADEPTTALDVTVQKTILGLLRKLQQENNMGVIYITHDLSLVAEIAHKVIVMYKGKIVEAGTIQNIFLHPQHPYTKALLACRPALQPKGKRLPVVSDFMNLKTVEGFHHEKNTEEKIDINVKEDVPNEGSFKPLEIIMEVQNLKVYFPARKIFLENTLLNLKR